ncbi:uncharacterized protein METZ01_LOCUS299837, partial [marine metagenome]
VVEWSITEMYSLKPVPSFPVIAPTNSSQSDTLQVKSLHSCK